MYDKKDIHRDTSLKGKKYSCGQCYPYPGEITGVELFNVDFVELRFIPLRDSKTSILKLNN